MSISQKKTTAKEKPAYRPRKTPMERMKELTKKRGKSGKPVWTLDMGITYSMLSRFRNCRERFRLSAVEGWSETGLKAALEFGSAFHACLENPNRQPCEVTREYQEARMKDKAFFRSQLQEFEMLMGMVESVVDVYRAVYKDVEKEKTYVLKEETFDENYVLTFGDDHTSGPKQPRTVRLRGRIDAAYRDKTGKLWLLETKTKSDIDVDGINRTLSQDLQTMFYATALELKTGEPVAGVLYNVIRRPALRQGKAENLPMFIKRVRDTVMEQQDRYFFRPYHTLSKGELTKWQQRTLNPLLFQVCQWWDSIKNDPFEPWSSPYHVQTPFGVYDPLGSGRRGDFFELLTGGGTGGLLRRKEPFPELVDD